MLSTNQNFQNLRKTRISHILIGAFLLIGGFALPIHAQFSSGSTGADGALNLASCPTAICELQIREDPIAFHYTTINIPAGKTLKFLPNSKNSPAILLATLNITISGSIDVSGLSGNSTAIGGSREGGKAGPGGFSGGGGGFSTAPYFNGNAGGGPGGAGGAGTPNGGGAFYGSGGGFLTRGGGSQGGLIYGTRTLVPLIGGSGGAGGSGTTSARGCGGGGGGGAILLASSTSIAFSGSPAPNILAKGGPGSSGCGTWFGGGGSGGAIRLVSNSIIGNVTLDVQGGTSSQWNGAPGRVRLETPNASGLFPTVLPSVAEVFSLAQPNPVFPASPPKLTITSVGGQTVNNTSNSPHGTPDIILRETLPNPVVFNITGENVPVDTIVRLVVTPQYGVPFNTKGSPLQGTVSSSTTTDTVNLPNGLSLITAVAEFDVMTAGQRPIFINGEQVQKIEVTAKINGESEITYITKSGKRVKASE